MSDLREALAKVLEVHRSWPDPAHGCMGCGWVPDNVNDAGTRHAVHVGDVILHEWLPGALADVRIVEAAAVQVRRFDHLPGERAVATTALRAAVIALTEEPA